jgi:hypothetical protein
MKAITMDLAREVDPLDDATAHSFVHLARGMLKMIKGREDAGRISIGPECWLSHPAIGTWPKDMEIDAHIAQLRKEWE